MDWLLWVGALLSAVLGILLLKVAEVIWWKPLQYKKYFEAQGIHGPAYKLVYGNVPDIVRMANEESRKPLPLLQHNIVPRVYPAYDHWRKTYGENFVFWFGTKPRLYISNPELVKEILSNKFGHFQKIEINELSTSLPFLEGEKWAQRRRMLNPAFHMELLKGMIPSFVESATNVLEKWSRLVTSGSNEIEVREDFSVLSFDAISRTAFGSNYAEGKYIFELEAQLLRLLLETVNSVNIPGSGFFSTRKNRQMQWLGKEISRCTMELIEGRKRAVDNVIDGDYGTDLLGIMMNSNKKQGRGKLPNMNMTIDEIISECQTFYGAGQETTATLLTWTTVLLAMHQDWQERGRKEVLEVCGKKDFPNADTVNELKIVGMILNESLRLYPPALTITRQTNKPMKLGRLEIPAGTQFFMPIIAIHHDPALWGNDVHEFNPERFSEGISKAAKHPMAFMPFSLGPRICIGQNFSMLEAKVVLAMILQRFSFMISPQYVHAPMHSIGVKPQHGAQIIFQHLN